MRLHHMFCAGAIAMLAAASAPAQSPVIVTTPTDSASLLWLAPPATGGPVDRYEVRFQSTLPFASVGIPAGLTVHLPLLTPGSYTPEVRACNTAGCSASVLAPMTVQDPAPPKPTVVIPATPASARIVLAAPAPPPVPTPSPTTGKLLFSSGWDNAALGCGPQLLDGGAWQDFGGSGACDGAVHDADIVSDVHHDGAHSLRITQKPTPAGWTGIWNGTDFRLVRTVGAQKDVTLTAWLRYDAAYRFGGADHKIFIFMDAAQMQQNVYLNFRPGVNNTSPRLCAYSNPVDVFFCASAPTVTVGAWFRLRAHIVAGTHGSIEMWLQPDGQAEVKLNLVYDAGTQANIMDLNVGEIGSVKYDSTFNDGASITAQMYQFVDSISVFSGLAP